MVQLLWSFVTEQIRLMKPDRNILTSFHSDINRINLFKQLPTPFLNEIEKISHLTHYEKDHIFFYEKETSTKILFLTSGLAKAYKIDKYDNEVFLYFIQEGDMLSEISSIHPGTLEFFSNIVFLEDSSVLSMKYDDFKTLLTKNDLLVTSFIDAVLAYVHKVQFLINREMNFDAVSKVAMMLGTDLEMFNTLKRHDIAQILHIQPSTLSRVLNKLKAGTVIDISHGKVSIIDAKKLKEIYN